MKQLLLLVSVVVFLVTWFSYSILDPVTDHQLNPHYNGYRYEEVMPIYHALDNSNQLCQPRNNIVFLKIHKCASSTVQNILMRYGDTHNLTFALPLDGNYFGHPTPFNKTMVAPSRCFNSSVNIICHHMRFNKTSVEEVMPKNAVYVAILRDPVDLFESLFSYYDLKDFYEADLPTFMTKTDKWKNSFGRYQDKIGRNQMSFDFGLDQTEFDNKTRVERLIEIIKNRFDLVMIAEYFDESLILLKNLMCWGMEDVVYFSHNARTVDTKQKLSLETKRALRSWNSADQILYNTFLGEFSNKIKAFGQQRLAEEVTQLERWKREWYNTCVDKMAESDELSPQYRAWSPKVLGFHLRENTHSKMCEMLAKSEFPFTDEIRFRQKKDFSILEYLRSLFG